MSVEHQPRPSESHERAAELQEAAKERLEQLRKDPETSAEQHSEKRAEAAREIIAAQEQAPEPPAEQEQAAPARASFVARLDHVLNYRDTMTSIQRKLSPVSRNFSKVIHTPAVENVSEALESTVMRPSIVAGATWSAALVGLVFYVTARVYGWTLSGSEMLAALLAGAVLGLVIEAIARSLRRR
jgi:hypothetical protein